MFNRRPYRNNNAYYSFLKGLFDNELIKVTVFKNEKEIIAGLIIIVGKNMLHRGSINSHSPFYAYYSPGYMQFLLMCQQLAVDRIEYFDLTLGDDNYIKRLANHYDVVQTFYYQCKEEGDNREKKLIYR